MVSQGIQITAIAMAVIGWVLDIVVCALPMWKVTAFIGANIITAQTVWQGLWMNCVVQSTGQMQCKVYDSMLALQQDLQAARAMTIISILLGVFGLIMSIAGGKCTNCIEDEASKAKTCIVSGVAFIVSGLLVLIPVCWSANSIISNFYNPMLLQTQKFEMGAALYIGWAASALLLMGGGLLCWNCPPKEDQRHYVPKFTPVRSAPASREYGKAPSTSREYV
ncbi:claudin-4-like [Cololabis saira]|uniref:claudin-4-like n=1 Tax=Cololabis saira TaxID=129043 RepID=UPI002AD5353A|nr:claudin-4-like [Cololabis saira]